MKNITSTPSPILWFKLLTKAPTHPRLFISSHFEFQCTQKGNNFGPKKKNTKCDSALRFHQKTIFTFLNSALRRSDNMEKCEPSHRRLLTWVRLTPSVWHTWKADHAYVPTQHATKKSHILGKHRSSSERSGSIQALFSPTSPFPIFWEFRSFTSTQRAASAAAGGGETPLQFKVG